MSSGRGPNAAVRRHSSLTRLDLVSWAAFAVFATSGVVTPVCLPEISRAMSTNLAEGGGMETARTFLVLVVVALAGFVAHRWGKKRFLTLGQYLIAAGLLAMSLAQSCVGVIASLMIVGVGGGLTEALVNPLVLDIHPGDSGKYLNLTNAFYPVGVMASALVVGELLATGCEWRSVFRAAAACALVAGVAFNVSRFPQAAPPEGASWKLAAGVLASGRFWLYGAVILLGAGVESTLTFWSRSHVETYMPDAPRAGAAAVALFAGTMAAGRMLAAKLSGRVSLRTIMIASALLGLAVGALLPLATGLASFYALLAASGLAAACFWPTILAHAAASLKTDATILFVMLACLGIIGFGSAPLLVGAIGDRASLGAGLFVVPCLFAGVIAALAVEWRVSRRAARTGA